MTITTIYKIYFPWYEFEAQMKFEAENPQYVKIAEDSVGVTYEYRTDYVANLTERKEE